MSRCAVGHAPVDVPILKIICLKMKNQKSYMEWQHSLSTQIDLLDNVYALYIVGLAQAGLN